ncbi:MAG: ABC transporter ATP-binding protein [Patescibacteria group bacterium]|nr:ABC transporter ATP-binding protein [Patescibacteria group bacterium]
MLIETKQLTKRYGNVTALDACSLSARQGEILGLLGPNGAGKTTLLRILLGYIRPTSGSAVIGGCDCHRQSLQVRRRTAYLPGEARLFGQMRGRDVLRFFAEVRAGGDLRRSRDLAERLELNLAPRVTAMSTGMRQKLALAATLAVDAELVILDEPTSNLDPTVRGVVARIVTELRGQGRTVLFSSHVLSEVEDVCDRVAFLRGGRLAHLQVMHDLKRRHRIRAMLRGPMPPPPPDLADDLTIRREPNGEIMIETPGELAPLLKWLANVPLDEMSVQPVGLRSLYDRIHDATPEPPEDARPR